MFAEGLSELVLVVSDVRRAARFYQDVVRLVPEREPDDAWAWFWTGAAGASPRLALRRGPLLFEDRSPFPQGERFGRVHYAFRVERTNLKAAVAHVQEHRIEIFGPVRLEWMAADSYYFYDPDGNLLEWWSPDPV